MLFSVYVFTIFLSLLEYKFHICLGFITVLLDWHSWAEYLLKECQLQINKVSIKKKKKSKKTHPVYLFPCRT